MAGVKNFADQLQNIWRGSTPAARTGLGLLGLLCLALVGGVGYWSTLPYYVALASDLQPPTAAALVAELDRANIQNQLSGAGTIVMVDKRDWARAQILARTAGVESEGGPVETLSPLDNALNRPAVERRNLERSLAVSLGRFKAVEQATVHLSIPEKHPFLRHRDEPAASIILTLRKNERFGEGQAVSMASLVANAVEGLRPQRVTITDTEGNQYSTPDESVAVLGRQEDFRFLREQELSSRAHTMLAKYLGHENVVVRISTDYQFPDGETETTTVDPEKRVVASETVKSSITTGQDDQAGGGAGTVSNLSSNSPGSQAAQSVKSKTEDTDTKYETSRTVETQRNRTPQLNLMTVSVIANTATVADEDGAIPEGVKEKIESVVKQAVGFRDDRDEITVEFFPFSDVEAEPAVPTSGIPWEQINEVLKNVSLAVGAVVALAVAWLLAGRLKPAPAPSTPAVPQAMAGSRLDELGKLAAENPEIFSRIIAAWATSSAVQTEENTGAGERRAA